MAVTNNTKNLVFNYSNIIIYYTVWDNNVYTKNALTCEGQAYIIIIIINNIYGHSTYVYVIIKNIL